jgi:sigma-E factor negative regulatory protein RseC
MIFSTFKFPSNLNFVLLIMGIMPESPAKPIEHRGIIDRFTDHSVIVKILSESACSACHAKGACSAADMQNKEIEVTGSSIGLRTGEMVNLIMDQSQGFKAVMIAYVYPFIVLFGGLLAANAAGLSEIICAFVAIGLLPPYFFIVYLFRQKVRENFSFSIRKIN